MKKVVIFCQADWAGSAYQVVEAINSIGRIEAKQVVCHEHPYGYDAGIVLPAVGQEICVNDCDKYEEALQVLDEADLIHTWNNELDDFYGLYNITRAFNGDFPNYTDKYASCTMTGTWYRIHYPKINQHLKSVGTKLVIQDPAFIMDTIKSTFIPHAVDTSTFIPLPIDLRDEGTIGCYHHQGTTANNDIRLLKAILKNHDGWRVSMEQSSSNAERITMVAKCMFFMQNMDTNLIGYGRSTLEAMSLGVPVINGIPDIYYELMPDIPILKASPLSLHKVLADAITRDYAELSMQSRQHVEKYHSYKVIGEKYTQFFEGILQCG